MSFKIGRAMACMLFLACLAMAMVESHGAVAFATGESALQNSAQTDFISADELKTKLAKNEPVEIIDVRGANGLSVGADKIKGAHYVKSRRLKYRLGFPPLNGIPRDREVVTYCACPNDEAALRAAGVLREAGFKRVRVLKGGWALWKKANGQIERM
jgi:rhodanese-related sulfurtransferase